MAISGSSPISPSDMDTISDQILTIAANVFSSVTIDSKYNRIEVEVFGISAAGTVTGLLNLNADAGANYYTQTLLAAAAAVSTAYVNNATGIPLGSFGVATGRGMVSFINYSGSFKSIIGQNAADGVNKQISAIYASNTIISTLQASTSGNLAAGSRCIVRGYK